MKLSRKNYTSKGNPPQFAFHCFSLCASIRLLRRQWRGASTIYTASKTATSVGPRVWNVRGLTSDLSIFLPVPWVELGVTFHMLCAAIMKTYQAFDANSLLGKMLKESRIQKPILSLASLQLPCQMPQKKMLCLHSCFCHLHRMSMPQFFHTRLPCRSDKQKDTASNEKMSSHRSLLQVEIHRTMN